MITKGGEREIPNGHLAAVAARLRLSSAEWGLLARMPLPDIWCGWIWAAAMLLTQVTVLQNVSVSKLGFYSVMPICGLRI